MQADYLQRLKDCDHVCAGVIKLPLSSLRLGHNLKGFAKTGMLPHFEALYNLSQSSTQN